MWQTAWSLLKKLNKGQVRALRWDNYVGPDGAFYLMDIMQEMETTQVAGF